MDTKPITRRGFVGVSLAIGASLGIGVPVTITQLSAQSMTLAVF
jgi:hypothetical protein